MAYNEEIKMNENREVMQKIQEHIVDYFDEYDAITATIEDLINKEKYSVKEAGKTMVVGGCFAGYFSDIRKFLDELYNTDIYWGKDPENSKYSDEQIWNKYIDIVSNELINIYNNPKGGGNNFILEYAMNSGKCFA